MVANSNSEAGQKAIQGIEAGQKNLSLEEWSAFMTLRDNYYSGNHELSESRVLIKVIRDGLPRHGGHRLLQKVHLPNFIKLCEEFFVQKAQPIPIPVGTSSNGINSDDIPSFHPPVDSEVKPPEPVVVEPVILIPPPPDVNSATASEEKGNANAAKGNKPLILIIIGIALLIGGWNVYRHWDSVSKWEPISRWLGKNTVEVDSTFVVVSEKDSAMISSSTLDSEKVALDTLKPLIQPNAIADTLDKKTNNIQLNAPTIIQLNDLLNKISNFDDKARDKIKRLLGNNLRVEGATNISNVQQLITDVSNGGHYKVTKVNTNDDGKLISITVRK